MCLSWFGVELPLAAVAEQLGQTVCGVNMHLCTHFHTYLTSLHLLGACVRKVRHVVVSALILIALCTYQSYVGACMHPDLGFERHFNTKACKS